MEISFEAAKFNGKWAVFDKAVKTFSHIGKGRKFCESKAKELNYGTKDKERKADSTTKRKAATITQP